MRWFRYFSLVLAVAAVTWVASLWNVRRGETPDTTELTTAPEALALEPAPVVQPPSPFVARGAPAKPRAAAAPARAPAKPAPIIARLLDLPPPSPADDPPPRNHMRELEDQWSSETEDPEWTRREELHLTATLKDLDIDGRVVETQCRTTLCQARLEFTDPAEARFMYEMGNPERAKGIAVNGRDSVVSVQVFFAR